MGSTRPRLLHSSFAIIAGVAMLIGGPLLYPTWLAKAYPTYYVATRLQDIRTGDRRESVVAHFDETRTATEHDSETIHEVWGSRGWRILPGDELVHCRVDAGYGAFFQFRDGKLVNFAHQDYGDPVAQCELNNRPVPMWARW